MRTLKSVCWCVCACLFFICAKLWHQSMFASSVCLSAPGHAVELPYVFHTATLGGFHYTPDELVLSDTLINYWTNFARYGNPNGKGDHDARGIGKLHPQVGWGAAVQVCMGQRTLYIAVGCVRNVHKMVANLHLNS